MINLDADVLKVDPGRIALGEVPDATLEAAKDEPDGPACQASLAAFRSALVFRNIFTGITAVLASVTAVALVLCIYRILDSSWDPTATFTAIGGAVTGAGALYLNRQRTQAISVLRQALADVGTYCGQPVKQELQ